LLDEERLWCSSGCECQARAAAPWQRVIPNHTPDLVIPRQNLQQRANVSLLMESVSPHFWPGNIQAVPIEGSQAFQYFPALITLHICKYIFFLHKPGTAAMPVLLFQYFWAILKLRMPGSCHNAMLTFHLFSTLLTWQRPGQYLQQRADISLLSHTPELATSKAVPTATCQHFTSFTHSLPGNVQGSTYSNVLNFTSFLHSWFSTPLTWQRPGQYL